MTPDEFRANGRLLVDWIARYLEEVGEYPVLSQVQPGDIRAKLPTSPPSSPEPFSAVLDDIDGVIMPGITHWRSPNFFAYFPSNSSPVSILGELLSAGLGVNGMSWATSPAATELETHVLDWMVDLLDLPEAFRGNGVIQDSASSATLCAILAARDRARANGTSIEQLVGYATSQAHSSIEKGLRVAGIPAERFRKVATDDAFAMVPAALAEAIATDTANGLVPFFVCAAAGATSTLAFDPVPEIAAITKTGGIWLHVDAAMAGIAALCPEFRWVNSGVEHADSYCTNAHKWMGVNFDCTLFYVTDRAPLLDALSILPPFLRTSQTGSVIDYRDWQVPLGRRFRALKLWFVLRCDGVDSIAGMVRDHVAWTADLASSMATDDRFELVAPVALSLLVFRLRAGDEATASLLNAVKASGRADLTQTIVDGRLAVRVSIGSQLTERRHVVALWELLQEFAGLVTDLGDAPVVATVTRSGVLESVHRGVVAGLDRDGRVAIVTGDGERPIFGRSSNKPLQAVAMVRAGLDVHGELLALVAASHSGEPFHIEGVRKILHTAGLDEGALRCPAALPLGPQAAAALLRSGGEPSRIHMNCSGKHAGMLATCVVNGWATDGYLGVDHPLQRHITTAIGALAGAAVTTIGIDGCGAPVHALSMHALAHAFRAIAIADPDTPEGTLATAIRAHPMWVGGTGRDVTRLLESIPGLVAKDGAEGVYAAAAADGRAVALKIVDGAARARVPVLLAAFRALGLEVPNAVDVADVDVLGGGQPVGAVEACWPTESSS